MRGEKLSAFHGAPTVDDAAYDDELPLGDPIRGRRNAWSRSKEACSFDVPASTRC